jgi:hypothetical protein
MPCAANDEKCWKELLPELPCQLHDEECWRKYKYRGYKDFISLKELTPTNVGSTMVNDTESIWLI